MIIKKGMYVRTIYGISQIICVASWGNDIKVVALDNERGNMFWEGYQGVCVNDIIDEPSFRLVNVLRVGDYVNGHKVISINNTFTYASVEVETSGEAWSEIIPTENIEEIMTQEQFKSESYKINKNKE